MTMRNPWPVMIMLVGAPYSGKSVFRNWLLNENIMRNPVVISTDDELHRLSLVWGSYEQAFENDYDTAKGNAELAFLGALDCHHDIIIDRTNMTLKARDPCMERAKEAGYCQLAVVFRADDAETVRRHAERTSHVVPLHVVEGMNDKYQRPVIQEGFFAVYDDVSFERKVERMKLFFHNWNKYTRNQRPLALLKTSQVTL